LSNNERQECNGGGNSSSRVCHLDPIAILELGARVHREACLCFVTGGAVGSETGPRNSNGRRRCGRDRIVHAIAGTLLALAVWVGGAAQKAANDIGARAITVLVHAPNLATHQGTRESAR